MAAPGRIDELRKRYEENQRRFFAPLANEYRKAGDLEQAIALCRMHLVDAPSNLSGQIVFGQALFDAGTLDESRVAFETAIGLDPENLIALRHLGDIARAQADVPRAREWYQRLLDADRRNEDVLTIMRELAAAEAPPPAPEPAPEPAAEVTTQLVVEATIASQAPPAPLAPTPVRPMRSVTPLGMPSVEVRPSAGLAGPDTPTVEIVAMSAPASPAAEPPAPAEPESVDLFAPTAQEAEPSAPESSFGFDVNLDAAADIPMSSPAEEATGFGEVELPDTSTFGEPEAPPRPSSFGEVTVEAVGIEAAFEMAPPAYESTVEEELFEQSGFDAASVTETPAVEEPAPTELMAMELLTSEPAPIESMMMDVTELVAEPMVGAAPAAPAADDALLDFEMDVESAPAEAPQSGMLDTFELTDVTAAEPRQEMVEEQAPAEPAAAAPAWGSFDPIREMPTPVAPIDAADVGDVSESVAEPAPETMEPSPFEPPAPEPAWSEPAYEPEPAATYAEAEPAGAEPVEAPAAATDAFDTETMAELYVRQGLRQEAIAIYERLVVARPDDANVRSRLAELKAPPPPFGMSSARAFFANLAGRRATPTHASFVAPPAVEPVEALAETPVPAPEHADWYEPAQDAGLGMETATEVEPAAAEVSAEPVEVADTASVAQPSEPAAAEAVAPATPVSVEQIQPMTPEPPPTEMPAGMPSGSLDALFGHPGVAKPDDSAAHALAAAFASPPPVTGRPTRAASDELSLDRVFREKPATPPQGGLAVPRQSSSLRFDQFFAAGQPKAPPPEPSPEGATPPADTGESEQFQAWLSGLKKP